MILLVANKVFGSTFCGPNFHFVKATRKIHNDPNFGGVRGIVSWASSCSCNNLTHAYKTTDMRKSMIPCSSSYQKPLLVSRVSSISSSSVATSLATEGNFTNAIAAATSVDKWDIYAGIVVERKPVLTTKKDDLQQKYVNYVAQLEYEISKKSDHEIRHDKNIKMQEKAKTGEIDLGNVQTARDDEDKWITEAQSFQPAQRETDADRNNDVKSLERALDSHLLLVVEQKLGKDYRWICPHAKLEDGETLRQASERMLRTMFPEMRTKVLGHAPWGFYKYRYPPGSSASGAKVFFHKAQIVSGEIIKGNGSEVINDFVWLKRDELPNKLQPEYWKKLSECLIDD